MKFFVTILFLSSIFLFSFSNKQQEQTKSEGNMGSISNETIEKVSKALTEKYGAGLKFRIERGVRQTASLWEEKDGTTKDFEEFCMNNFLAKDADLDKLFSRLSTDFEIIGGLFTKMNLKLSEPLQLDMGEILPIDQLFGGWNPSAHFMNDFYENKIAFHVLLNFPFYSLNEKNQQCPTWTRKQWAYARMGDMFYSRVPADLLMNISKVLTEADTYISEYNIFMGNLTDNSGKNLFPKELKLITHWGLRDELKSQYANADGLEKQKMIYEVMKHIINQDIPKEVINKNDCQWNPYTNKVNKEGKEIQSNPEPNTRYKFLLENFRAVKATDKYYPNYPTYIKRKFEQEFEIPQERVEELFVKFVSSPQVKKVAELISKRLNRKLEPFDIWYDGFKARSSISEESLNETTKKKYPVTSAVQSDLVNILLKLGFSKERANFITSKIQVDPSRGAGHATGAAMKEDLSHLRTRIGKDGMNYKGYNIAVHEFGHNVEQTISIQDVDYFMMGSVPNTAFTEAWAFVFQKRDLDLLGIKETNPDKEYLMTIDNFWMTYEIMCVSLVDMEVWKWLYKNPDASPEELRNAVISISKEVWNKYCSPVFGSKDQTILAIYSHMIDYPLYLSAYPIGHVVEFQIEKQLQGKNFASEMERMLKQGKLLPDEWMKGSVGKPLSIEPTLEATEEALKHIK